jgi:hypothetical protein
MTNISTVPSIDEYLRERLMPVEGARKFMKIDDDHMAQFLALGLQLPAHHPDLKKYYSLNVRQTEFTLPISPRSRSRVTEIFLSSIPMEFTTAATSKGASNLR